LKEITDLMDSYLDGEEGYSVKNLKWKLEKYFGSDIVITKFIGTRNVITFRDKNHRILKDNWEREAKANVTSEKDRIIDMAASIIRDDTRTATYDTEVYPNMDSCQD
jgi:hydrogenase maturation factor HypF (carbamoyltransferase family)